MAVVYSLFVHSLSLFLSVLVPPRWRFRPSSSLRLAVYQTPCQHQRTNTPRAFLNILFTPRLLFFFASILVSRACLFLAPLLLRRFELIIDAPWILPSLLCSAISFSLLFFFGLSFRTDFSSLPVFTDRTRYRCVPLAVSTFRTFLPPFRCFILDALEDKGFRFYDPEQRRGEGKGFSASVSLNCFLFFFFHFDIIRRSIFFGNAQFREELNWINIILPNSSRRKRELKANACHWLENRYFFIFSPDRKFPQIVPTICQDRVNSPIFHRRAVDNYENSPCAFLFESWAETWNVWLVIL